MLARLAGQYAIVAIVSGRPAQEVRSLLGVPEVEVFGLYGLTEGQADPGTIEVARSAAQAAANEVEGAWVEDKGRSLAVHYRAAPDPRAAEVILSQRLSEAAGRFGLALLPGKMVLELAPQDIPGKGGVVMRECRSRRLEACLYAGDDRADQNAFAALEGLRNEGLFAVKIAVRAEETPKELIEAADLVVDRPAGLVRFLQAL